MKKLIVYMVLLTAFVLLSSTIYSQEYIADNKVAKEAVKNIIIKKREFFKKLE